MQSTRTHADKSYYEILNVDRTASQAEIKKAFRRLAKKYHPDTNPEDDGAAEKLDMVMRAYRVLSNERERARYDVMLRTQGADEGEEGDGYVTVTERAQGILEDLLSGRGEQALEEYDELCEEEGFELTDHLDMRDYLDCLFLLAEQCEHEERYQQAAELYEELYQREKEPPRHRYFVEEVKDRIKKLYSRKLPHEADSPQDEIACYERILDFDVDRSEKAFLLKKIAEVHCRIGQMDKSREIFKKALELKPGLKGTATIREQLGIPE